MGGDRRGFVDVVGRPVAAGYWPSVYHRSYGAPQTTPTSLQGLGSLTNTGNRIHSANESRTRKSDIKLTAYRWVCLKMDAEHDRPHSDSISIDHEILRRGRPFSWTSACQRRSALCRSEPQKFAAGLAHCLPWRTTINSRRHTAMTTTMRTQDRHQAYLVVFAEDSRQPDRARSPANRDIPDRQQRYLHSLGSRRQR